VTFNAVSVDVDKPTNVTVLGSLSAVGKIDECDILNDIVPHIKRAVEEIISRQNESFSRAGREPEPIALFIWGASGDNFNFWNILTNTYELYSRWEQTISPKTMLYDWLVDSFGWWTHHNIFQRLTGSISEFTDERIRLLREKYPRSWHVRPFDNQAEEIKILTDTITTFRNILCNALVCKGEYSGHLRDICDSDIDENLLHLKQCMNDGDISALEQLKEVAYNQGRRMWDESSKAREFFALSAPHWYHDLPQEKRDKYSYSYYLWHPQIIQAFDRGFAETYDHKIYKVLQLPIDRPMPPFVTPLRDIIYTQDRISKWEMKKEDLEYHTKSGSDMRDEIVWKFDSALAFLSEAPQQLTQLDLVTRSAFF
jgi:hypothetical protein